MTSPMDKAGNRDRDAAIKVVDAALASGRIVQADHDKRVDEIRRANLMQDLQTQTADLVSVNPTTPQAIPPVAPIPSGTVEPTAPTAPSTGTGQQWPLVNYGSGGPSAAAATAAAGKAGRRIGGIVAAIVLVSVVVPIVGAIVAFASARNSFNFGSLGDVGPSDTQTYLPGQQPGSHGVNVHTVDGFNKMLAAVKQETGGNAMVYEAVLYPRYAVLELPNDTGTGHYQDFYWNGKSLSLEDIKDQTDDQLFDLSKVDPTVMINTLKTVRARVDTPTSWYCVAGSFTGPSELSCYASNDYDDQSYEIVTFDGTLVYDSAQSQ